MLDLYEMSSQEIKDLLQQVEYGHLGCACEGHPYVVPMKYYPTDSDIYLFTTEGLKTQCMDANPEVCLQVEDVHDLQHWRSVIATGRVERLVEPQDIDRVMKLVQEHNPTLSPAMSRTWIDAWGRANIRAIYRMQPNEMSGRKTA
ncbi:pyridoxamine 5'-phosphate oxidase family protein [Egbenema bharatensis]|uniref:pyridoxamine 5'-phosphate oxidase family protein n=1 Tax=Egbenema bharatensis TaxID=3463334 RepID=UPI003A8AB677